MKNKMIPCKQCGKEIAASAKTCPHCGSKNKKPIFKRWWFWLIIVVILGSAVAGGSSGTDADPSDTPPTEQSHTDDKTPQPQEDPVEEDNSVPSEYKAALKKAATYSKLMSMSKAGIYDQLTSEYGEQFPAEAAQYAIDHLEADWNANALAKAKSYNDTMHSPKPASTIS